MNKLSILAVGLLALAFVPRGSANATSGSIGFATPLLSEANASPTGNINTSHLFTLENLSTTDNASGVFAGLPIQSFGIVSFNTMLGNSLHISDGEFGSFTSRSITTVNNSPGFLNLLLVGTWTPGTFMGGSKGPADFRISFTQSPVAVGEISFSGTMSTVAAVLPEPGTWLLFITGAVMILAGAKFRSWLA